MTIPVTVVIPCHNMANTLGRAIESAMDAAEIIIVQDGESEVIKHIGWSFLQPGVLVYSIEAADYFPSGVSNARNVGIQRAKHALILPLDADDELLPGALQAMYDAWQEGVMVYGGWREDDVDYQAPPIEMIKRKSVCHATMLFSREDWLRVGGYDIKYNIGYEDWAFMLKLYNTGVKAVRLERPLYVRNVSDNGRTAQVTKYDKQIREIMKLDGLL